MFFGGLGACDDEIVEDLRFEDSNPKMGVWISWLALALYFHIFM
jgi:hypothetical protein